MLNQIAFSERLKHYRKRKGFTQDELAARIRVSGQAVSKWEKGNCLPDIYNLKNLAQLYRVTIDDLLDIVDEDAEEVIQRIQAGDATFEILQKPETILTEKMLYAKDFGCIDKAIASAEETPHNSRKRIALS